MADQFCLKWNNYQLSLTSAFKHILEEEDFVDVTLSAGGNNLKAHKVVLSACSSYFRDLLKGISLWQHPVLVLKDVRFLELQSILEFVYLGEVNVEQDRLESFLKTAELLRIKGLTDGLQSDKAEKQVVKPNKEKTPPKLPLLKPASILKNNNVKRPVSALSKDVADTLIAQVTETLEKPAKSMKMDEVIIPQHSSDDEINYEELTEDDIEEDGEHIVVAGDPVTNEDIQAHIEQFGGDADSFKEIDDKEFLGPLHKRCPHCQMVMLKKNLSRHIRDQHSMDRPRSTCPICQKSYKTPDWLKDHIRRGHGYTKEATDDLLSKMVMVEEDEDVDVGNGNKIKSPASSPLKISTQPAQTQPQLVI